MSTTEENEHGAESARAAVREKSIRRNLAAGRTARSLRLWGNSLRRRRNAFRVAVKLYRTVVNCYSSVVGASPSGLI